MHAQFSAELKSRAEARQKRSASNETDHGDNHNSRPAQIALSRQSEFNKKMQQALSRRVLLRNLKTNIETLEQKLSRRVLNLEATNDIKNAIALAKGMLSAYSKAEESFDQMKQNAEIQNKLQGFFKPRLQKFQDKSKQIIQDYITIRNQLSINTDVKGGEPAKRLSVGTPPDGFSVSDYGGFEPPRHVATPKFGGKLMVWDRTNPYGNVMGTEGVLKGWMPRYETENGEPTGKEFNGTTGHYDRYIQSVAYLLARIKKPRKGLRELASIAAFRGRVAPPDYKAEQMNKKQRHAILFNESCIAVMGHYAGIFESTINTILNDANNDETFALQLKDELAQVEQARAKIPRADDSTIHNYNEFYQKVFEGVFPVDSSASVEASNVNLIKAFTLRL